MIRFRLLPAAVLALAACGEPEQPQPRKEARNAVVPTAPPASAPVAPSPPARGGGEAAAGSAAAVVRNYHRAIAERDYRAAWRLREASPRNPTEQAFAAAYSRYAEYRATVGTPSESVSAGGWDYVEVPVQIEGRGKAGEPFASAGTVTVRRRSGSGAWRIAPGG